MRVALFGGTFDPPHRGHLAIARAAADTFQLNSVLLAPVGRQPLKEGWETTPFSDRLAMVELACQVDPRFQPSTIDAPLPNGAPNYTVNTLAALRAQMPAATIFSLVGADSFLSLSQWREPQRLLALAEWIVVSRPGSSLGNLASLDLTEAQRKRVHRIETVQDAISATELRRRLALGEGCGDALEPSVEQYIRQHHLYRSLPASDSVHPSKNPS
jgi:nicotinate-nucleotide adenylyltransferase